MNEPLTLVTGVVTDLVVYSGEDEFVRNSAQRTLGVGVATGLAAAGLAGAAMGSSIAATSAGDSVEFFSCKVDGKPISGRFSKTSFREGQVVSAVVAPNSAGPSVSFAIRSEDEKLLWMSPHGSRGSKAHRSFAVRSFWWIFIAIAIGLCGMVGLFEWYSTSPTEPGFLRFTFGLIAVNAAAMAAYFSVRFYRQWLSVAREAERVFAALGYRDPSRVDLPRDHKRYCKAHGIKWPYLTDGPWIYRYIDPR